MTRIRFEDLPSTNTPRNAENLNKLNNVVISPTKPTTGEEVWLQKGKNLFDKDNVNYTKWLSDEGEPYTANEGDIVTSFIDVLPNTNYTISGLVAAQWLIVCGYDINKNFVSLLLPSTGSSGISWTINVPSNVAYIRCGFSGFNSSATVIQIEEGITATPYEPFTRKIYTKNDNGVYEEFYNDISGINEKGHFTKRADGTLIQRGKYTTPLIAPTSGHTQLVNLPINFIDNDYNVVTQKMSGGSIGFATVEEGVLVINNSRFDVTSWNFDVSGNAEPLTIGWVAIGRWK